MAELIVQSPTETLPPLELELKRPHGVILLIITPDGLAWTNWELKDKPETDGQAYTVSTPTETCKENESIIETALHAILGEFARPDERFPEIASHLNLAYFNQEFLTHTSRNPHNINAALGVLVYDGPVEEMIGNSTDEVSPNGWIPLDYLTTGDNIRLLTQHAVREAIQQGVIERALTTYRNGQSTCLPQLYSPMGIDLSNQGSLSELSREREEKPNVTIPLADRP